jgi:hypothetical protein
VADTFILVILRRIVRAQYAIYSEISTRNLSSVSAFSVFSEMEETERMLEDAIKKAGEEMIR